VTITNDAWFGKTSAPYQHFSMATFRAVENRVFVARAANTGITGFIDPRGKILKQGGIFTEEAMNGMIRLSKDKTFYTLYGDVFAWCCSVFSIFLLVYTLFQKPNLSPFPSPLRGEGGGEGNSPPAYPACRQAGAGEKGKISNIFAQVLGIAVIFTTTWPHPPH
jgi:hypothetical protein